MFFLSTILGLPFLLGEERRGEAEFRTDLSTNLPELITIPALFRLIFGDLDPKPVFTREDLDIMGAGLFRRLFYAY